MLDIKIIKLLYRLFRPIIKKGLSFVHRRKWKNIVKKEHRKFSVALFFSIISLLVINFFSIIRYYQIVINNRGLLLGFGHASAFSILFIIIFTLIYFILSLINNKLLKICFLLLNIPATIYNYAVGYNGLFLSHSFIENILENSDDLIEYVEPSLFIIVSIQLIIVIFITYKINIINYVKFSFYRTKEILKTFFIMTLFALFFSGRHFVILNKSYIQQFLPHYAPLCLIGQIDFIPKTIEKILIKYKKNDKNIKFKKYNLKDFLIKRKKDPLLVIFIQGESLRSDRLHINNYHRQTTPYLDNMKNTYVFKNVRVCYPATLISSYCFYTNNRINEWHYDPNEIQKTAFSSIFKEYNFKTIWNSMQENIIDGNFAKFLDCEISHNRNQIIATTKLTDEMDTHDHILVNTINHNIENNTLYILSTRGSHYEYRKNYPRNFAKFQPDECLSDECIKNAYDNTVLYFDSLIAKITQKIKNKNAIMIYVSDHGESLGENGIYKHGASDPEFAPREQLYVPMIIWMSDTFVSKNKKKAKKVEKLAKLNKEQRFFLDHDYIFHTILDCSGFYGRGIDRNLSLCSKKIKKFII